MTVLVVTGTGTGVGKTVVMSAIAALAIAAGRRVAVLKAAQTGVDAGQPGDVDEVRRLVGSSVTCRELARYPDPLAPATAARRAGLPPVTPATVAAAVRELAAEHDLVMVEGAGGLLVPLDDRGGTLADVAAAVAAPVLVVAAAGLGTLNHTALTVEVLRTRGLGCVGLVIGAWPTRPDLAAQCNLADLPAVTGLPLLGALREGAGRLTPEKFLPVAQQGLGAGWQVAAALSYMDWGARRQAMTAELYEVTREQLTERRRVALARLDISERALRQRAVEHVLTPEERDALNELEEIDFLLGDGA